MYNSGNACDIIREVTGLIKGVIEHLEYTVNRSMDGASP